MDRRLIEEISGIGWISDRAGVRIDGCRYRILCFYRGANGGPAGEEIEISLTEADLFDALGATLVFDRADGWLKPDIADRLYPKSKMRFTLHMFDGRKLDFSVCGNEGASFSDWEGIGSGRFY